MFFGGGEGEERVQGSWFRMGGTEGVAMGRGGGLGGGELGGGGEGDPFFGGDFFGAGGGGDVGGFEGGDWVH